MLAKRLESLTPKKKLTLLKRILAAVTIFLAVLLFVSMVVTASNLMVVDEFSTSTQLQRLHDDYPGK